MGWLVVALFISKCGADRYERGKLKAKDYAMACGFVLPAFALEFLSDLSLRKFLLQGGSKYLLLFALFSFLFLIFLTIVISVWRFGIGISNLSDKDYSLTREAVSILS